MRLFTAAAVPAGEEDTTRRDRPVQTSLPRGPWPVLLVCGACGGWLAVGHRPHEVETLLACPACRRVNDPQRAVPEDERGAADAPGGLATADVWARAAVERVHTLAARERRWPWRAGTE